MRVRIVSGIRSVMRMRRVSSERYHDEDLGYAIRQAGRSDARRCRLHQRVREEASTHKISEDTRTRRDEIPPIELYAATHSTSLPRRIAQLRA
jgi:hypothetical protein